jgi:hypothetical protein
MKVSQILLLLMSLSIGCLGQSKTQVANAELSKPNYALVFPQNRVNTLEIAMTKADWDSINVDMKNKFGNEFGKGGRFPGAGMMPKEGQKTSMPNAQQGFPPRMGGGMGEGGLQFGSEEPNYRAVTLKFNGKVWTKVGFRLKGNSTLMMSWGQGLYKLPFRLSFDEFEKQFPEAKNQRFYGFKELSMSPGANDNSLIREKVTADIFREAGIPAAQTAFYKVYIDFGEGPKYCGVYTMVEVIDDTMIKTQFGDNNGTVPEGNIYKPESTFQRFNAKQFEKKNNKKQADYADVEAFVKALNDPIRTTQPTQWRTNLEKAFNVAHFLKYLAVNNVVTNWDTYGGMAHNFYLYNSPSKKLTWIPWDNNEAMSTRGPGGGMRPPMAGLNSSPSEGTISHPNFPSMGGKGGFGAGVSLDLAGVGKNWPLIRFLADDPVYFTQYKNYVQAFTEKVFTPAKMTKLFAQNQALIAPFVVGKQKEARPYSQLRSEGDFESSLEQLNQHVINQNKKVREFMDKNLEKAN